MTYFIEFVDSAKKELKNLVKEYQLRIISVLERIKVKPHSFALRLSSSKAYRVRAGKLRVIIDIIEERQMIVVLKIVCNCH